MVATAGLPLEVTLVKGRKSKPSLAMANRTLGIGNIEPKRLERRTETRENNNGQLGILNGWSSLPSAPTLQRLLPGGQSAQRTHGYHIFGWGPSDVFKGHGQGAFLVQQVVGHHQGESGRHGKVRHETDE